MSTTPIAQPLAALNANPAPARSNAAAAQPAVQFGQTLSREIAQRQAMQQQPAAPVNARAGAPRPAEKAPAPAARPEQGAKAEQAAAPVPDAAPARPAAPANNSSANAQSGDTGGAPATADSAAAAAAAADSAAAAAARAELPVADMLALVASLTQPAQAAAAPAAADPSWSTLGSGRAAAVTVADPNQAADAALAAFAAPAMAAAGRLPAVDGAPTAPAAGALGLPAEPSLATESGAAPAGDLRALLEGAMPRAAGAATESAQGQAAPTQTGALQTAAVPADAARLAPAARELPESVGAIDLKAAEPAPVAAPLQQAALGLAQAANAGADKLSARVGTPAWDNQVGQKIVWMVAGKEQSATLTLNPPDLGPVQVVLNVTGDNASVTFSSGELEVRQALENAMPKLREMMDESGISLGNASVNAGMPEQRQDQGERATAASADGSGAGGGRGIVNGSAADANERLAARTPAQGGALGLVDTFA
ncbi:flagellar hook-length control protein FliK [Massilia atriviolacea]|uniref:Flagellar hook-length control protein FliK n=1 Tax=Massilia atriviolacea TaxID=2495579 RepID=A0A430HJ27_9BURK|nr:flagellar hook-length control protein FliK [Massilia atriviolacea]RSZ57536.1 flagellar hook-length control protein FliK [Massilia atriviolacea]